ncbi:MAG: potassium transporter TrkG [Clostridia bacterium]
MKKSPYIIIAVSFAAVILLGMLLLKLPFSVQEGQSLAWVDSLFISTSAICVTGLSPIMDVGATLSIFGKFVLALLIQIGGLGFVTIAVYIMVLLGVKIGIEERQIVKEALNQNTLKGLMRLVKQIVFTTIIVELSGFVMYMFVFTQDYDFWTSIGFSAFHAISAFNNCGFDLLGAESFMMYKDNILLNINVMMLIMLGGLGFIVISDVFAKKFNFKKFNLHTRTVLIMSTALWVGGMCLLKITEGGNITWLQALFQSVGARTAGFATMDMSQISNGGALVMIVLMIIGAAPCSTGGGIKITSAYAIIKSIIGHARGKRPMISGRAISEKSIYRAYILLVMSILAITMSTFLMSIVEKDATLVSLIFESASAFGTVGFSMGLTPSLHTLSKLVLVPLMYMGRLGPLTLMALLAKRYDMSGKVGYIEEPLIIG